MRAGGQVCLQARWASWPWLYPKVLECLIFPNHLATNEDVFWGLGDRQCWKSKLLSLQWNSLSQPPNLFSFSEILAQDLPLKLLLFKTQRLPPTQPKCVVTVRVWLHANCGGVLWGHLKGWPVDNEHRVIVFASCPLPPFPIGSSWDFAISFPLCFCFLPERIPFVLAVTQSHSFPRTNIVGTNLVTADGWVQKSCTWADSWHICAFWMQRWACSRRGPDWSKPSVFSVSPFKSLLQEISPECSPYTAPPLQHFWRVYHAAINSSFLFSPSSKM